MKALTVKIKEPVLASKEFDSDSPIVIERPTLRIK
jgi:hypothetical protein